MSAFLEGTGFGLVLASILSLAAVGFTLQWGVSRFINIAYASFMILAAFFENTFEDRLHLGFWPSAILATICVACLMVVMNQFLVQPLVRRGVRFFDLLVAGFGLGIVIQYSIQALWGPGFFTIPIGAGKPLNLGGLKLTPIQLVIIGAAVAVMLGFHLLLSRTDLGRAMRAVSVNPVLAQSCGVRTSAVLNLSWLLSGALCAIAGLVLAIDAATFNSASGSLYFPDIIAVAIVGGIGSPYGAMLSAVLIGLVSEWVAIVNSYLNLVVALAAGVLILLFRPEGLLRSPMADLGGSV